MQTIAEILSKELNETLPHVQNVIELLDGGNTVPFIARYRKEMHGSMDDQQIRRLADRLILEIWMQGAARLSRASPLRKS